MFSYAQAAKGLAPSTQNTSSVTSSSSSDIGSRDIVSTTEPNANSTKPKITTNTPDIPSELQLRNGQSQLEKVGEEDHTRLETHSNAKVPENLEVKTVVETKSASNAEKDSSILNERKDSSEGDTTITEQKLQKLAQNDDIDKNKDNDDDWEKVSVPSIAADKELKAAPIPIVNIWQQRKEAQDARIKDLAGQRQTTVAASPKQKVQAQPDREDNKRRPATKDTTMEKESTNQRRNNSGMRPNATERKEQSPSQLSSRSLSKKSDKNGTALPATGDAESWPTPEGAVVDERRRSTNQEKSERVDNKVASQKKWVQMQFVPTAKFETQLPPAATARRGGRAANRGRDHASRGGHSASTSHINEKNEVGSMGPPPVPKQAAEQDRGRKGDNPRNQRASSVPNQTTRAGSNDEGITTLQKTSAIAQNDQSDVPKQNTNVPRSINAVGDENSGTDGSRSSSQQPSFAPASNRKHDADALQATPQMGPENNVRGPTHTDQNRATSRDDFRSSNEFVDRSAPTGREWSRGRPDSTREKSDSWRERREPRAERGRGGYRGRGNHSSFSSHSQTYTAPLPQNGFESSKQYTGEGKSRQVSQPFSQSQSPSSSRNFARSQSIPLTLAPGSYYPPMQSFAPQAMSPASTDAGYVSYSGQMPSGIMNAMPYADQLNSMALISMVITQLEYYFSINNLCKDLFLRKNMDSQGFVPLGVIAGFKRIRALTDGQMSHEQFRAVCQQAPHVEFVTTDNGEDKLRARGNWRDFILPIDERLPSAQNDGPNVRSHDRHYSSQMPHGFTGQNISARSPTTMNGFSEPFTPSIQSIPYPPPAPFDGPVTEGYPPHMETQNSEQARRSSTTSPFSQIQSPTLQTASRPTSFLTNGHHHSGSTVLASENNFPDEKIPELKVVVRDPAYETSMAESANGMDTKTTKLRGGAGSPQQLDRFKHIQFGQASPDTEEDQTPFWTKHGHIAKVPEGPSFVHEDYLSLRDKALNQRDNKHFDGALAVLYPFWSSFLVENFNFSMYQEFASFAAEEVAEGSQTGQNYLLQFYDTLLKRRTPMSERMASDLVGLFNRERERGGKGPVSEMLRNALRNGATDFKTVKRLMDLLKKEEKTELGV